MEYCLITQNLRNFQNLLPKNIASTAKNSRIKLDRRHLLYLKNTNVSAGLNIPLHPELAVEQANEDGT